MQEWHWTGKQRTVASGYRGNLWRGSTVKTFPLGVCHVSGSVTSGSHGIPLSALALIPGGLLGLKSVGKSSQLLHRIFDHYLGIWSGTEE